MNFLLYLVYGWIIENRFEIANSVIFIHPNLTQHSALKTEKVYLCKKSNYE